MICKIFSYVHNAKMYCGPTWVCASRVWLFCINICLTLYKSFVALGCVVLQAAPRYHLILSRSGCSNAKYLLNICQRVQIINLTSGSFMLIKTFELHNKHV